MLMQPLNLDSDASEEELKAIIAADTPPPTWPRLIPTPGYTHQPLRVPSPSSSPPAPSRPAMTSSTFNGRCFFTSDDNNPKPLVFAISTPSADVPETDEARKKREEEENMVEVDLSQGPNNSYWQSERPFVLTGSALRKAQRSNGLDWRKWVGRAKRASASLVGIQAQDRVE